MFQGIGFRHALASAQLLFFAAVMIPYQVQLYELRHPGAGNKSDIGWSLSEFGPSEWVQACEIVNAPAVLVSAGIGRFLPERLSWIVVAFMGCGVFLQWYLVGLWRDKRAGLALRETAPKLSPTGLVLVWAGLVVAAMCALLAVAAQIFYFRSSNSLLISLTIWCGFFAAFLLARIRGRDKPESGESVFKL